LPVFFFRSEFFREVRFRVVGVFLIIFTSWRSSSRWHPFSRSYGVRLPSSLTRVLSNTLVSSTCLPVSVCGTVEHIVPVWLFSAPSSSAASHPEGIHSADQQPMRRQKKRPQQFNLCARFRNINLTAIDYAIWPRLRTD